MNRTTKLPRTVSSVDDLRAALEAAANPPPPAELDNETPAEPFSEPPAESSSEIAAELPAGSAADGPTDRQVAFTPGHQSAAQQSPDGPEAFDQPTDDEREEESWFRRLPDTKKAMVRARWAWEAARPLENRRLQRRRLGRRTRGSAMLMAFTVLITAAPGFFGLGLALSVGALVGVAIHYTERSFLVAVALGILGYVLIRVATGIPFSGFSIGFLMYGASFAGAVYGIYAQRVQFALIEGSDI